MKVVGVASGEDYSTVNTASVNADGIRPSFDYNLWNNNRKYNLQNFTGSLQKEMGTGNIADLMAYNEIAKVQVAAEMPGARVVGLEDKLSETRRLSQLEQSALQPHKTLGPFKLLRYEIVNAGALQRYDNNGSPKLEKMYRIKLEYGYRLIDHKKAYHQNMHDLALDVLENANKRMMHLGDLRRFWFNDKIFASDLQMDFFSPYRWHQSYNYRKLDLRNNSTVYPPGWTHGAAVSLLGGIAKGLFVGPRISMVSTKPMTEERVKNLMSILDMRGTYEIERAEANN
ncbi:hypothetical protein M1112_02775 [Candidatus Parvarchaeota archaeon]|jgi:hypothetical protein|nr:hypothetical protein [Candidatus Parvarchaeota archaeon]